MPVPLILFDPVRVRFSTLFEAVKETEVFIKSVPSEEFSVTVSVKLLTIYVSLPSPPIKKS